MSGWRGLAGGYLRRGADRLLGDVGDFQEPASCFASCTFCTSLCHGTNFRKTLSTWAILFDQFKYRQQQWSRSRFVFRSSWMVPLQVWLGFQMFQLAGSKNEYINIFKIQSKKTSKRHQLSMTFPSVFRFLTRKTSTFDDFFFCF